MASLRCCFFVQGEGRGHMTQALALQRMLARAGHRVTGVVVGQSGPRTAPSFFVRKIEAPITYLESPAFVTDARNRGIRLLPTLWKGLRHLGRLSEPFEAIEAQLRRHCPDVVINFFEPTVGLYYRWHRPSIPMVAVAHQYMFDHPAYRFPDGHGWRRKAVQLFARVTAWGAARRLALSLYPVPSDPARNLQVVPPLLRETLFAQPIGYTAPFFLIYVLNSGYAEEIIHWHDRHPEVRLHCFWDRADGDAVEPYDETLTFHRLDDEKFLSMMARCRGLVSTAGFESVAEAMYLGKPVQVIPVEGHFEQQCNALDTVRAGGGIRSARFDLSPLQRVVPAYRPPVRWFRSWVGRAETRFVRAVEQVASAAASGERAAHRSALPRGERCGEPAGAMS